MGTAQGLIDVARGYLGTTEDDPRFRELIDFYNANTGGYDMSYWDEWCACFVSVCSIKSGNRDATGTSVNCAEFRRIWQEMGIYRERWETPAPGWLIDYDWQQDGIPDHIGIVVDCDGETIHVIEGNTDGEICAEHWIPVGNWSISCFAAPNYQGDAIVQEPGDPVNDAGLVYRVHEQNLGWLPPVRDGQTAGIVGHALRMEAFKITPPEGWELDVKVHIENVGWVPYDGIQKGESSGEGSSHNDPIIGTTGESKRIEDVIISVVKRPEGDKRRLYFQVHQENAGWKGWTPEGMASGTDGMGIRLEAIRMKVE